MRYLLFQLLAKLLKSKNPDDLQEANKLIKSMVKEVSPLAVWHSSSPALSCRELRRSLVFPMGESIEGRPGRPGGGGGGRRSQSKTAWGQSKACSPRKHAELCSGA